jgi:hypothetical protein
MRKLFRSRKAVSGVISGVFLVLVIFLASNVAIWFYNQQVNLQAQSRAVAQLQRDRNNEQFNILYVLVGSTNTLNATIQNTGPVAIHIVNIIVTETSPSVTHVIYSVTYYIDSGDTLTNIGQPPQVPAVFSSSNTYQVTFITERGNGVSSGYSPTQNTWAPYATFSSLGYLSLAFNPSTFEYTASGQSTPTSAWAVTNSENTICTDNVMFWVTFTNHGSYDADLLQWSVVDLLSLQGNGWAYAYGQDFYIVASSSTYNSFVDYNPNSPVDVPANPTGNLQQGGTPTVVKFASQSIEGNRGQYLGEGYGYYCNPNSIYDAFILVAYTYNGQQYNQLVPFAGIVLVS